MDKILIVGPSWVGDMIMAHSLLRTIKQQNPQAAIDVLAPAWSNLINYRMPEVRAVITLPLAHRELGLLVRYKLGKQLRAAKYTKAYILPNSWKAALIPFFAMIPIRTGWYGESRFGLLNDIRFLAKNKYPKLVQRYVALAWPKNASLPSEIIPPKLLVDPINLQKVIARLDIKYKEQKILAICPGAAFGSAKRWPEEYFSNLARQKIIAGWKVWMFGAESDKPTINKIIEQLGEDAVGCFDFSGKINLLETIDLFSLVDFFICNDSGLMHLAASLNKPLVAIYGPTSPIFTPPLNTNSKIIQKILPCSPCFKRECPLVHHKCMRDITVTEVLAELNTLEST